MSRNFWTGVYVVNEREEGERERCVRSYTGVHVHRCVHVQIHIKVWTRRAHRTRLHRRLWISTRDGLSFEPCCFGQQREDEGARNSLRARFQLARLFSAVHAYYATVWLESQRELTRLARHSLFRFSTCVCVCEREKGRENSREQNTFHWWAHIQRATALAPTCLRIFQGFRWVKTICCSVVTNRRLLWNPRIRRKISNLLSDMIFDSRWRNVERKG